MAASTEKGTLVRVSFTAKVKASTAGGYDGYDPPDSTVSAVSGTSGNHFLNLASAFVTGDKTPGGSVTATFNGIVTGVNGTIGTRAVQEVLADGSRGLTHYIYLGRDAAFGRTAEPSERNKAVTLQRSDIRTGDKVSVAPFEAEIVEVDSVSSCVKVKDDDGNVSYVFTNRLTKIAPYQEGKVYLSNGRSFYRYVTGKAPGENGTWVQLRTAAGGKFTDDQGGAPQRYDYPGRPMREVAVGDEIAE